MAEALGGFGLIIAVVFGVFYFLMPFFVFSAQSQAHKCYKELKKQNEYIYRIGTQVFEINKKLAGTEENKGQS